MNLQSAVIPFALLALCGCTTATVSLPDGTKVQFSRFASDADLLISPESMHYSSSPSAVAQQNAQALLGQVLGLALRGVVPGAAPAPQYRYQPQALPMMLMMSEYGL
jgi:hypothetical protein